MVFTGVTNTHGPSSSQQHAGLHQAQASRGLADWSSFFGTSISLANRVLNCRVKKSGFNKSLLREYDSVFTIKLFSGEAARHDGQASKPGAGVQPRQGQPLLKEKPEPYRHEEPARNEYYKTFLAGTST